MRPFVFSLGLLLACTAPVEPTALVTKHVNVSAPTDLVIDEHGWPHAFGTTLRDTGFAQGYAMASDRMPQLELFRRTAEGRLAEVFGAISGQFIESDVTMRTLGLHRTAQQMWAQTPAGRNRDLFEGFAAGVNAYLRELRDGERKAPRGSELLLSSATAEWTPVDSLAVLRLMEMFLSFNADTELNRSLLRDRAREVFEQAPKGTALAERHGFFPDVVRFDPPSTAVTVPGFYAAASPRPKSPRRTRPRAPVETSALASLRRVLPAANRLGVGTNAWAIAGAHTHSGHALLANDPHLPLTAPSILWGVHLSVSEGPDALDVTGVAFPGVPGVVFGHNARVAWGITNGMFDQMDVYDETLSPGGALFNGVEVPLQTRVEQIPNGLFGTLAVTIEEVPHHGPLLPVFEREGVPARRSATGHAVSVRWVAAQPTHEVDGLIALMYSTDSRSAAVAVRPMEVPGMGFVFADDRGELAFQAVGRIPLRARGALTYDPVSNPEGTLPAAVLPGTGEAEWVGWLDPKDLPASSGTPFIATANNDLAGLSRDGNPFDERVYLSSDWSEGFRAERIGQLLHALGEDATREDLESMQADHVMLVAQRFMPFLLAAIGPGHALAPKLAAWDFDARADSFEASVFHAWLARVLDLALTDEVEALAQPGKPGPSVAPAQRLIAVLSLLERHGNAALWDDLRTPGVRETRDDILRAALSAAEADLAAATRSTDPAHWQWGALHTVRFSSVLPHFSLSLGADLSIPPHGEPAFGKGGGIDTLDQGWPTLHDAAGRPGPFFESTQGPARRLTVEMTPDGPLAFDALPGGESGDLRSSHFRDEAALWVENRSHPLWRTRADVDAHAEQRVRLLPR